MLHWRLRFVDCDQHIVDPVERQTPISDTTGDRLDEVERLTRDDCNNVSRNIGIVHGGGQIIRDGVQGKPEFDVDHKNLTVTALLGEDPVVAGGGQP